MDVCTTSLSKLYLAENLVYIFPNTGKSNINLAKAYELRDEEYTCNEKGKATWNLIVGFQKRRKYGFLLISQEGDFSTSLGVRSGSLCLTYVEKNRNPLPHKKTALMFMSIVPCFST